MNLDIEMKRILAPAMVAALAVGCGGEGGDQATGGTDDGDDVEFPVAEEEQGSVSGVVLFSGSPPPPETIDMSDEPTCADHHDGEPTRPVAVVDDGRLGEVFVRVSEGVPEDLTFPTPSDAVVLDQEGCIYRPHVLGIQTGQTLEIRNSDGILHNINASPSENRGFNISQPVEMESTRTFSRAEVMIPVRCDVHGWMESYIGVQDHPYFAVSDEDGSFTIERLPAGDYVVEAWHERYGTRTMEVTVAAGEEAEIEFEFDESMAEGAVVPLGDPIDLHDHAAHEATTTVGAEGAGSAGTARAGDRR